MLSYVDMKTVRSYGNCTTEPPDILFLRKSILIVLVHTQLPFDARIQISFLDTGLLYSFVNDGEIHFFPNTKCTMYLFYILLGEKNKNKKGVYPRMVERKLEPKVFLRPPIN
jgi:hypothetical protein